LFHGPRARAAAVERAASIGRLLSEPIGDGGLNIEDSRRVVELFSSVPLGDKLGVVVIGPLDEAVSAEAGDALLKTFEEFDGRYTQPVLWAHDAHRVSGTIRSRCLQEWCPAEPGFSPQAPYIEHAKALCEAALRRRTAAILEYLSEHKKQEGEILRAAAEVLAHQEEWPLEARLTLWESLRGILKHNRDPSPLAAVAAFLV